MSPLVQRFLAAASRDPDHIAIVAGGKSCSYGALRDMVYRLAQQFSVGSEPPRVAICGKKGPEIYAAMLAAMAAGGFYVPINREAGSARIETVMREVRPTFIFTDGASHASISAIAPEMNIVPFHAAVDGSVDVTMIRSQHHLAYVMYTSGSTGSPKGVMISQQALDHYTGWAIQAMGMSPSDRMSQHPNVGFDLSVLDIYASLCAGSTLIPLDGQMDRLLPARAIARHNITVWNSVPSVMGLMLKSGDWTAQSTQSLRLLTFCGEPLLPEHLEGIFSVRPDVTVHNTYGPTEATVSCTLLKLNKENFRDHCHGSVALGEPIPGTELRIDGDLTGELLIGGVQLADGYWNDDKRTAKAFVQKDGQRFYRTGDFVSHMPEGLFFVERRDHQVKIKGYRVELGEINAQIRKHGFVTVETIVDGLALISFIEGNPSQSDLQHLRKALEKKLDSHMIPTQLVPLQEMPRNSNDKIELNALRDLWQRMKDAQPL